MFNLFQVLDLVELLKSKKEPWDLFRELLNEICKKFPAEDTSKNGTFVKLSWSWGSQESNSVSVSLKGFLFLEAAEAAMKSTEQKLELVVVEDLRFQLLSAVGSRLARQQGDVDTMEAWSQPCNQEECLGCFVCVEELPDCGSWWPSACWGHWKGRLGSFERGVAV